MSKIYKQKWNEEYHHFNRSKFNVVWGF